ncbi:MAG: hypothetical protein ACPGLY_05735 [Rubripirellula sp.]
MRSHQNSLILLGGRWFACVCIVFLFTGSGGVSAAKPRAEPLILVEAEAFAETGVGLSILSLWI